MVTFHEDVDGLWGHPERAVSLGATEALPPTGMEGNHQKFSVAGFVAPEGNFIGLVHNG